jgi:hypothetical protein
LKKDDHAGYMKNRATRRGWLREDAVCDDRARVILPRGLGGKINVK